MSQIAQSRRARPTESTVLRLLVICLAALIVVVIAAIAVNIVHVILAASLPPIFGVSRSSLWWTALSQHFRP